MRDFIVNLGDKSCSGHARAPEIGVAFRLTHRQGARHRVAIAAFGKQSFQANGFTTGISAANDSLRQSPHVPPHLVLSTYRAATAHSL